MSEADAYRRAAEAIEEAEMWRNIALLTPYAQSWRWGPFEGQEQRGLKPLPPEWYRENRWYREQQEKRAREVRRLLRGQQPWQLKQQIVERRRDEQRQQTEARRITPPKREAKVPMYPAS